MTERWDETYAHFTAQNPKMIYYLSMEFLQARTRRARRRDPAADARAAPAQGRALLNAVGNMGLAGEYGAALKELGTSLEARARRRGGAGRVARAARSNPPTRRCPPTPRAGDG